MKPVLGWTLLSSDALKQAETALRPDVQGVRDEIGFLAIHQLYSHRFFPGTSVLHTRLRYALFVPWIYQRLRDSKKRGQFGAALEREEITLAGRLNMSDEKGVIGGRSHPDPTTQPASMVYWTALGNWRILRPLPSGDPPGRAQVHRALSAGQRTSQLQDADKNLIVEDDPVFASVPAEPSEWNDSNEPLNFWLRPTEVRYLRGCLLAVDRPGSNGEKSLLAQLVEASLNPWSELWNEEVYSVADSDDRAALDRAWEAAALSAIGRAVYASLVETMRDNDDGVPTENVHREHLDMVLEEFGEAARQLDIDSLRRDAPNGIREGILGVLRATQSWLEGSKRDVRDLYPIYEEAEIRRKGRRARLVKSIVGREKRNEWLPAEHAKAEPLHYRWYNVRRLLMDLQGTP